MKSVSLIALFSLALSGGAYADGMALAQKNACLSCHSVDNKIVGPAFKSVAAKFKGQKGAEEMLVQKVLHGSQGAWGPGSVMPPNPQVSPEDAKQIVAWILSL